MISAIKTLLFLLGISLVASCENRPPQEIIPLTKQSADTPSIDEKFRISYNITDLKLYKDTTKFIARYSTTKKYNKFMLIELTEVPNGIILCAKQPIFDFDYFNSFDSTHSLPFNQLCYWLSELDGQNIKNSFLTYNTSVEVRDIKCPTCLDPEGWTIQLYNHGKYSSTTKDYTKGNDKIFIDQLFKIVNLNSKNGFRIKQ